MAVAAALAEIVIWRALRSKWTGERDGLWPWSDRLRRTVQAGVLWVALVVAGAWKARGSQGTSWPGAFVIAGGCVAGLGGVAAVATIIERRRNQPEFGDRNDRRG